MLALAIDLGQMTSPQVFNLLDGGNMGYQHGISNRKYPAW